MRHRTRLIPQGCDDASLHCVRARPCFGKSVCLTGVLHGPSQLPLECPRRHSGRGSSGAYRLTWRSLGRSQLRSKLRRRGARPALRLPPPQSCGACVLRMGDLLGRSPFKAAFQLEPSAPGFAGGGLSRRRPCSRSQHRLNVQRRRHAAVLLPICGQKVLRPGPLLKPRQGRRAARPQANRPTARVPYPTPSNGPPRPGKRPLHYSRFAAGFASWQRDRPGTFAGIFLACS